MAYNEVLGERIMNILNGLDIPSHEAKVMFGGVGYLLNGNMACGVHKDFLVVRVGPENYVEALEMKGARPFDITGRTMKGWVMVSEDGIKNDSDLKDWVISGVNFALTLPEK